MRRTVVSICVGAGAALSLAVSSPASAEEPFQVYERLAQRRLHPAPLVFTRSPASIPIEAGVDSSSSRRRGGYVIRLVHYGPFGPDAIIALEAGQVRSLAAGLAETRGPGARVRRAAVRGHPGYLLRRRAGKETGLLWREEGRVYEIATGTPRKVSLADLRRAAAGLEHLGQAFSGMPPAPSAFGGAVAVTTEHTISAQLEWSAECLLPGRGRLTEVAGSASVTLQRLRANGFTIDLAAHLHRTTGVTIPWSGTAAGTVGASTIALSVQASATYEGAACDTGAVSFALAPLAPLP